MCAATTNTAPAHRAPVFPPETDFPTRAGLPQPWFMLAHSMGGCIGLRGLMRGMPVKAAVFSAPMWGIAMAAWLRPVASVVSALAAPLGLTNRFAPSTSAETYLLQAPFAGNVLTTDREMWDYMRRQVAEVPDLALRWRCCPRPRSRRSVRWGPQRRWWMCRRCICGWRVGRTASSTSTRAPSTRS